MQVKPFDMNQAQWDQYRAFHRTLDHDHFIQFDTGEVIYTGFGSWRPDERRSYHSMGVEVFMGSDRGINLNMYDPLTGDKVFKSQLDGVYLYDEASKRVVSLSISYPYTMQKPIPQRFLDRRVNIYWGGNGHIPVPSGTVNYTRTVKSQLTKEQRGIIKERVMLCKTYDRVVAAEHSHYYHAEPYQHVLATDYKDMTDTQRRSIARIELRYDDTHHETTHLEVR